MFNQEQIDEFEALNSIFSEDLKKLPGQDAGYQVQIHLSQLLCRVSLSDPLTAEFSSLASSDGAG